LQSCYSRRLVVQYSSRVEVEGPTAVQNLAELEDEDDELLTIVSRDGLTFSRVIAGQKNKVPHGAMLNPVLESLLDDAEMFAYLDHEYDEWHGEQQPSIDLLRLPPWP
jgi:hypothetical protein